MRLMLMMAILTGIITGTKANDTTTDIRVVNTITPPASVEQKCMIIDGQGLLWMGTNSGVKSYDGYRFTSYRSDAKTPDLLPNNSILSLAEDKDGDMWIGIRNGLVCMDKRHGMFATYHLPGEQSRDIYALFVSSDSILWIGTDNGVTTFNPKSRNFQSLGSKGIMLVDDDGKQHPLPYINAKSFAEDELGNIYIGTWSQSIYRLDRHRRVMHRFSLPAGDDSGNTYMVALDAHGRLWISTWGNGIKCLTNPTDFTNPGYINLYDGSPSTAINYRIIHDPVTHTIWTCSRYGIGVLDEKDLKGGFKYFHHIANDDDRQYTLRNVTDICTDGKGNVWAQTLNDGIFHIHTQRSPFTKTRILPHDASANRIRSIYTPDGKTFWFTLAPAGIAHYDKSTGQTLFSSEIPGLESLAYPTVNTHMSSIVKAPDGSIWFANNGYGIVAIKDGKAHLYNSTNSSFVKDNYVKALCCTRNQWMFVGERHHLNWLSPGNESFSLDDDLDVVSISEDHTGAIWVTTENKGILKLSGNWLQPSSLRKEYFNPEQYNYAVNDATCIFEDSKQRIWATSNSGGLFRLDEKEGCFRNINDELHWDFDRILSIEEDRQGNLWLTVDDALVCLSLDQENKPTYTTYTAENGLGNMIFMPNSCYMWGNELYLGSGPNLLCVNTSSALNSNKTPASKMMVTDIIIDGKRYAELPPAMQRQLGNATPPYLHKLTIPAGVNKFSVEFALLSYINASKCKYAYMLEGYDEDWHYVDAEVRQASFENLPSGSYRLHLKAADSYGQWNELAHDIQIRVLPPWYASLWAYIIYICIVVGGLYAAMLWYRERLRTMNRLQMTEVFTNIAHELLTPLAIISASAENIVSKHPELSEHTSLIHNNLNRLTYMLRQILEVRKSQEGKLQLQVSEGMLGVFCHNACQNIVPILSRKRLTLVQSIACDKKMAWFDEDKVEKILYNLLSNAVKYSNNGGRITVGVHFKDDKGIITVSDTGIGIPEEKMKHLYSRFLDGDYRRMGTMGTGIGLSLVHDLVKLHHGEISCESEVGKGTAFTITLPISRESYQEDEVEKEYAITDSDSTGSTGKAVQEAPEIIGSFPSEARDEDAKEKQDKSHKEHSVLIVEDNGELLRQMSSLLAPYFNVKTAVNGERAQRIIEKTPLDIVVTDVMMPVMDGIELTRWIKQSSDYAQLPVIMLTAKTQGDDRNEGYRAEADAYLTKPFRMEDLRLRIMNIIKNRELVRQRFQRLTDFDVEEQHYSSPEKVFVENVIAKIKENITNSEYGREQLAADMCISSSSLYNKLRSTTGQNITGFINSIRLKEACRILRQKPDIRINELSYMVGFTTPRYFSQCFKKEFGMTVKDYLSREKGEESGPAESEENGMMQQ